MMLIFTALILFVVYYFMKNRNSVAPVKQLTNLEILKRRYAMGEISREQYLLMLKEFE
jgi:putative membrane protein